MPNNQIFAVVAKCSQSNHFINTRFDIDGLPRLFANLDDAKRWIRDIVDDDIIPLDCNIHINPDIVDNDGDSFSLFGWGGGAFLPWMSVLDDDGVNIDFWIHRVDIN